MNITELNRKFKEQFGEDLTQTQAWGVVAMYAKFLDNQDVFNYAMEKAKGV